MKLNIFLYVFAQFSILVHIFFQIFLSNFKNKFKILIFVFQLKMKLSFDMAIPVLGLYTKNPQTSI